MYWLVQPYMFSVFYSFLVHYAMPQQYCFRWLWVLNMLQEQKKKKKSEKKCFLMQPNQKKVLLVMCESTLKNNPMNNQSSVTKLLSVCQTCHLAAQ